MNQAIVGYHLDENADWVAELACAHYQHVRHQPPFINRPWVISEKGRKAMLGHHSFVKNVMKVHLKIMFK